MEAINRSSIDHKILQHNDTSLSYGNTDLNATTPYVPRPKESAKIYFSLGLTLSWIWTVLIISLNTAVLVTICGYKKRSRLYFFLLNLAIADLVCGILDAFPHAIERTVGLEFFVSIWLAGTAVCKIQRTIANTAVMASNYLLAAMSMDRAYVICKPMLNIRRGNILQKVIVVACWLISSACSSPLLIFYESQYYNKRFISFSNKQQCILNFGDDVLGGYTRRLYLMFVFMFIIPLLVIMGSYVILVVSIYRRALQQTPSERVVEKDNKRDRFTMSRVFNGGVPKSKVKSIKLTLGIVLSFIVCWMAFFTGNFLAIIGGYRHPSLMILTTFYYWNSIANPILFFIYHRKKVRDSSTPSWVSETTQFKRTSTDTFTDKKPTNKTIMLDSIRR